MEFDFSQPVKIVLSYNTAKYRHEGFKYFLDKGSYNVRGSVREDILQTLFDRYDHVIPQHFGDYDSWSDDQLHQAEQAVLNQFCVVSYRAGQTFFIQVIDNYITPKSATFKWIGVDCDNP